jgi:hypothetical protein
LTQKITFAVEDARVIKENPNSNFAVLSFDFFASGENLHDLYISEETLFRTANTIKNCPILWVYDEQLDDIYTHDPSEAPCGFIPESSEITSRVLEDGRTMLSVTGYVWKRYTGKLLDIFKRDNGKKPVSVEMRVLDSRVMPNGKVELTDYSYEGITVLGSYVTPAIPSASATVMSFSKLKEEKEEYEKDYNKEFSFSVAEEERIKKEKEGKMEFDDTLTFPYKNISEINPALKGIKPPITVGQANAIAAQADAIGSDEKKNGWAIAIASFKKTHTVKDGKWVKKNKEEMEMSSMGENTENTPLENMESPSEENETPEEEKRETPETEKKEEQEGTEKKFGFPKNFNLETLGAMFSEEDGDEDIQMAKNEISKGQEFANPELVMGGMYAKMCKMAGLIQEMSEKNKMYMAENEELKKFKASIEETQKKFTVEQTIKELSEKVIIPDESKEEMIKEAEKYSLDTIEQWKTYCKAKSFDFAVKETNKDDVIRVGFPFSDSIPNTKKDSLWS